MRVCDESEEGQRVWESVTRERSMDTWATAMECVCALRNCVATQRSSSLELDARQLRDGLGHRRRRRRRHHHAAHIVRAGLGAQQRSEGRVQGRRHGQQLNVLRALSNAGNDTWSGRGASNGHSAAANVGSVLIHRAVHLHLKALHVRVSQKHVYAQTAVKQKEIYSKFFKQAPGNE